MAQGKRISADISVEALQEINNMVAAARRARIAAGEGQAAAATRLGACMCRRSGGSKPVSQGSPLGMSWWKLVPYGITTTLLDPGAGYLYTTY